MASHRDTTVLVTGATGFIAQHVIVQLLDAGYTVRGTARAATRDAEVRAAIGPAVADAGSLDRYTTVEADLTSDTGWGVAITGCRFVQHIASPLPRTLPKTDDELIVPARDGALRVLRAAAEAGVERAVMTSSIVAVLCGVPRNKVFTEADWSDVNGRRIYAYEKSKTIAERAAWDFARSPEAGTLELACINPGLVLGPVLSADYGTSGEIVKNLLNRDFRLCPDFNFCVVDVRDVAAAHLAAMTTPDAAGERFLCATENASMRDVARILDRHCGPMGFKVPTTPLPGFLLRAAALFDHTRKPALSNLGVHQDIDNSKIRRVLGWQPRALEEMVTSMADSMIAHGVVTPHAGDER